MPILPILLDPDQDLKSGSRPRDKSPPPTPIDCSNSAFETLTFSLILDCIRVIYKCGIMSLGESCQGQIIITPVKIVGSRCATAKLFAALTSHLFGPLVTNFLEMAFHLPETLDKNLDGTFRIRIDLMRIRIRIRIQHFF